MTDASKPRTPEEVLEYVAINHNCWGEDDFAIMQKFRNDGSYERYIRNVLADLPAMARLAMERERELAKEKAYSKEVETQLARCCLQVMEGDLSAKLGEAAILGKAAAEHRVAALCKHRDELERQVAALQEKFSAAMILLHHIELTGKAAYCGNSTGHDHCNACRFASKLRALLATEKGKEPQCT